MTGNERARPWLAGACLGAALLGAAATWYTNAQVVRVSILLNALVTKETTDMQVKVTTWYSKINGVCVLQSVSTPKGAMTDEEWQTAHRRAVADMMEDYPPDADCPVPR